MDTIQAGSGGGSFGSFDVQAVLSEGGMGVVYRAVHRASGLPAAIKTLRAVRPHHAAHMRREINALTRIRHAGVVRILEQGVTGGVPWYAMELIAGRTLAAQLSEWWAGDVSRQVAGGRLSEAMDLMLALCPPLAALHQSGVVHRDLKPRNIVLRESGGPVLVDFGLAGLGPSGTAREVVDVLPAGGTPEYMAPEQIALQPVDARADLYSLGCVFYEILTGRPPFSRADGDVTRQHLRSKPVPPSEWVAGVPAPVENLVLRLLEKKRRFRPASVEEVQAELTAATTGAVALVAAPSRLFRPALAGREAELQEALATLRGAGGALLWVTGEAGAGKTAFASELARRLAEDHLLIGGAASTNGVRPDSGGTPLGALLPALATLADRLATGERSTLSDTDLSALAHFEPRLLSGTSLEPLPLDALPAGGAGEALAGAARRALEALAREAPLLLVLDDLHWADELTARTLRSLDSDWLAKHQVRIVGTFRSDEANALGSALLEAPAATRLALRALDASSVTEIVADLLGLETVPLSLDTAVAQRAGGNPFFAVEYLRTAVSAGLVRRAFRVGEARPFVAVAEVTAEAMALPAAVRELVLRRLLAVSPAARLAAERAAVVGRELGEEDVDAAAHELVAELLAHGVLEQGASGRWRFAHDLVREAIYTSIPEPRRQELHRACATQLLLRVDQPEGAVLHAPIAHHFLRGGCPAQARRHSVLAGEHALRTGAYGQAAALFQGALEEREQVDPDLPPARSLAGLAKAELGRGNLHALEARASAVLAELGYRLGASKGQWKLALLRAAAVQLWHLSGLRWPRRPTEARRVLQAAGASAAALLTHLYFYEDDGLRMVTTALLSANLAEDAGTSGEIPRVYTALGGISGLMRARGTARRYFQRARGAAALVGHRSEASLAWAVEAVDHCNYGRWDEASACVTAALAEPALDADVTTREIVLATQGHVHYFRGDPAAALAVFQQILTSASGRGHDQHRTWALFSLGRSLLRLDREQEALPLLEEAAARLAARAELQSEIICQGLLGWARWRAGDGGAALRAVEAARTAVLKASPTAFVAVEGYRWAVRTYVALARDAPLADRGRLLASSEQILRAQRSMAALFPVTRAALWCGRGWVLCASGRERRGRRAFARAAGLARRYRLPMEAADAEKGPIQ